MCGRYALYGPASRLRERFEAEPAGFELTPRWNAAPMQWLPVIRQRSNGERVIHLLRWGLVPSWAKDEAAAIRLINARGESVSEKPSFRAAFRRRRCIVPANGFYEWQQVAGGRQPFFIHPVDGEFFALAGLWERWTRPADGEEIDTFTIVTTEANAAMRPLHDRMPVILAPGDHFAWLNGATPAERLQGLVHPCPEAALALYPVGKAVGNVRNEGAGLIVPIGDDARAHPHPRGPVVDRRGERQEGGAAQLHPPSSRSDALHRSATAAGRTARTRAPRRLHPPSGPGRDGRAGLVPLTPDA
jgi:putative SOS response-associated peptidase YedK